MGPGVVGAAGFLDRSELHQFDAGSVGIVQIELPFAVAADFGLLARVPAVFAQQLLGSVDVGNAESDVVHHPKSVLVGVSGDVEHVFEPVGAVRDLHVDPVGFVVLHAAVPVDAEAEEVFVEFVFGDAIGHDEPSVNQTRADLIGGRCERAVNGSLHKGDGKAFGILERKVNGAVEIPGDRVDRDVVGLEITVHSHSISSGKGDFSKKICVGAGSPFGQGNLLVVTQDVTRAHHACATGVARDEAKNRAVETERRVRVGGPEADVCDAGDRRPVLTAQGHGEGGSSQSENQNHQCAAHRITSRFRYRLGF
jgi:hypothetical protein